MGRITAAANLPDREICDIYNIYGGRTGKTFVRGEPLGNGQFVMVVDVWIVNRENQILIQKRSKLKKDMPNTWATHSGCVQAGETALQACIRETGEEIGIRLSPPSLHKINRKIRGKLLSENFIAETEFDLSEAVLQAEEVSEVRWVSAEALQTMAARHEFYRYPELPDVLHYLERR